MNTICEERLYNFMVQSIKRIENLQVEAKHNKHILSTINVGKQGITVVHCLDTRCYTTKIFELGTGQNYIYYQFYILIQVSNKRKNNLTVVIIQT